MTEHLPLRSRSPVVAPIALRIGDAAFAISVSKRTARRLIAAGDVVASRIGRAIVVQAKELEAFLVRNRIGGVT